ncbi:MAG TPA: tyrosine-type recombinase/integrase, partial [Gemmatimonadales bacterium]|nr:tyrosine-type recombinase/integrase [Gemmatimonadales bacterium]
VSRRALTDWRRAGLAPIGLHEARHTFASLAIAAGVNAKALSVYMGHASVTITLDRYGHLFPGNENEAAGLLDAYLRTGVRKLRDSPPPDEADFDGLERSSPPAQRPRRSGANADNSATRTDAEPMPPAGIEPATPGLGTEPRKD